MTRCAVICESNYTKLVEALREMSKEPHCEFNKTQMKLRDMKKGIEYIGITKKEQLWGLEFDDVLVLHQEPTITELALSRVKKKK